MKTYLIFVNIGLIGLLFSVFITCKKETPKVIPTITASAVTNITAISATSGGAITSDGGAEVTARGVCWSSTNTLPTTADSKTTDGSGIGNFTSSITGLTAGTTYNTRTYALNSIGTGYSGASTFKTLALAPTLTTTEISAITATSFSSGGNILNDGGSSITARGVCWSVNQNPSISVSKTADGTGTGAFISTVTGINPGNTYFIRAYATNSIGTSYGDQLSAKTSASLPTLATTAITNITSSTAICGGNITSDGGGTIIARGVCWSVTTGPTTASSKTNDNTGTGNFTSSLTGLTANTIYFVKAYATNSAGSAYGSEVSFKTLANLPTLSTIAATSITKTTALCGGLILNDGGAAVTARGVCWSTSQNPTTSNNKTLDGSGTGSFISLIPGLTASTTYYVRSYAVNSVGTAYGTQVSFVTYNSKVNGSVSDVDGNTYSTITIGTQVWMVENLRTAKFNDNTDIPAVPSNNSWSSLTNSGYCWYNNNISIYGALYNWYTVNTGKLCPLGWHVPSDTEWTTLITYLGGEGVAGGKLKETGTSHWLSPNYSATNETGFTALPGGNRDNDGSFSSIGVAGNWWSSTMPSANFAWFRSMYYGSSNVGRAGYAKQVGFSVRCLRD